MIFPSLYASLITELALLCVVGSARWAFRGGVCSSVASSASLGPGVCWARCLRGGLLIRGRRGGSGNSDDRESLRFGVRDHPRPCLFSRELRQSLTSSVLKSVGDLSRQVICSMTASKLDVYGCSISDSARKIE